MPAVCDRGVFWRSLRDRRFFAARPSSQIPRVLSVGVPGIRLFQGQAGTRVYITHDRIRTFHYRFLFTPSVPARRDRVVSLRVRFQGPGRNRRGLGKRKTERKKDRKIKKERYREKEGKMVVSSSSGSGRRVSSYPKFITDRW